MQKKIYINVEKEVKEELRKRSGESDHQMMAGPNGQFVDTHFNMDGDLGDLLGPAQVETLLQLQVDSDTLRVIEDVESENEVLDRIIWPPKEKS